MLKYKDVYQAYQECLDKATGWLNANGYPVNKAIAIQATMNGAGSVIVKTTETLHLRGWPYRAGSRKKIDILASMLETVSLQHAACTKATLYVSYFRVNDKKAEAMESLHYDYHAPKAQHPICHVQHRNEAQYRLPESFDFTIDESKIRGRYQNVRIPSAFVNLGGLFVILAADHMTKEGWREFMGACLEHFRKLPCMATDAAIDKAIASNRLRASAWYEIGR